MVAVFRSKKSLQARVFIENRWKVIINMKLVKSYNN